MRKIQIESASKSSPSENSNLSNLDQSKLSQAKQEQLDSIVKKSLAGLSKELTTVKEQSAKKEDPS